MRMSNQTILIYCGKNETLLNAHHGPVVVLCPVTWWELKKKQDFKNDIVLFGDFAPNEEVGSEIFIKYRNALEEALTDESKVNPEYQWAPLSFYQISVRLVRFVALKKTFESLFSRYPCNKAILSSDGEKDIVHSFETVCSNLKITSEVISGPMDYIYPYYEPDTFDLTLKFDPFVVTYLKSKLERKPKIYFERYWNLSQNELGNDFKEISINRMMNVISAFPNWVKRKLLKRSYPHKRFDNVYLDERAKKLAIHFKSDAWKNFTDDEIEHISNGYARFFSIYNNETISKIVQRYRLYFKNEQTKFLVVSFDVVSSSRLLIYAAKQENLKTLCLFHGISYESNSPRFINSPFQCEYILPWEKSSEKKYQELGYKTTLVRWPRLNKQRIKYKDFYFDSERSKVLILSSHDVAIGSRDDTPFYYLLQTLEALKELRVNPENIFLKHHNQSDDSNKMELISKHRKITEFFSIKDNEIPMAKNTLSFFNNFDLIIMSVTTGIYEAAISGVPVVVFSQSLNRVGTISGLKNKFNVVTNKDELVEKIANYNNIDQKEAYDELISNFLEGSPLPEAINKLSKEGE